LGTSAWVQCQTCSQQISEALIRTHRDMHQSPALVQYANQTATVFRGPNGWECFCRPDGSMHTLAHLSSLRRHAQNQGGVPVLWVRGPPSSARSET
jgi:hypothetical protein